jgi:hypothetical protein
MRTCGKCKKDVVLGSGWTDRSEFLDSSKILLWAGVVTTNLLEQELILGEIVLELDEFQHHYKKYIDDYDIFMEAVTRRTLKGLTNPWSYSAKEHTA